MDDVPFEELMGLQGSLVLLLENATTILLSNLFFLAVTVMLPFNLGRLCLGALLMWSGKAGQEPGPGPWGGILGAGEAGATLAGEGDAHLDPPLLSDILTLGVGYAALLAAGAVFGFIFVFFKCLSAYTRFEVQSRLSLREIILLAPFIARRAYAYITYSCVLLKVTLLLVTELGVFPLVFGMWLDMCSLKMFDIRPIERAAFAATSPISFTAIHWTLGIGAMFFVCCGVSALREIIKPGLLTFLRDPADPNINPFRELFEDSVGRQMKRIMLGLLIYGTVALLVIYMPINYARSLMPQAFPFELKLLDPLTELPIHLLMIHFGLPLTMGYLRPKAVLKAIFIRWLRFCGRLLNIEADILQQQVAPGGQEGWAERAEGWEARGAAVSVRGGEAEPAVGQHKVLAWNPRTAAAAALRLNRRIWKSFVRSRYTLKVRIAILYLVSTLAVQACNVCLLLVPLLVGRAICIRCGFPHTHDLYNILIGVYSLWGLFCALDRLYSFLSTHGLWLAFIHPAIQYGLLLAKCVVLGTLWWGLVPLLCGLLVDLTVLVPLTVPLGQCPSMVLYQEWAVGLLWLKLWHKLVAYTPNSDLVPAAVKNWKLCIAKLEREGIFRTEMSWAVGKFLWPMISFHLLHLAAPYLIATSVLPRLALSEQVRQVLHRYIYTLSITTTQVVEWNICIRSCFWKVHDVIKDDRYLVGRALENMD